MNIRSSRDFSAVNVVSGIFSCFRRAFFPRRSFALVAALLALLFPGAAAVEAQTPSPHRVGVPLDWPLTPSGLNSEGKEFRLIFLTQGIRNAESEYIEDYNSFVQSEAAGGHSALSGNEPCGYWSLFRALASTGAVEATEEVEARDNMRLGAAETTPIYWLNGPRVADDAADFYDGNWDNNDVAHRRNQSGVEPTGISRNDWPWTGTNANGTAAGENALGKPSVRRGRNGNPISGAGNVASSQEHAFYALSPIFVVQQVVPPVSEPILLSPGSSIIPDSLSCGTSDCAGYSFRLMFLSTANINGHSTIGDYNDLVVNSALSNPTLTTYNGAFRALASTPRTSAAANTGTSASGGSPIFWVNGSKVADNNRDLYELGLTTDLYSRKHLDPQASAKDFSWTSDTKNWGFAQVKTVTGQSPGGSKDSKWPWTGTNSDGSAHATRSLGCANTSIIGKFKEDYDNMPKEAIGTDDKGDIRYIRPYGPINSGASLSTQELRPVYGLSREFFVGYPSLPSIGFNGASHYVVREGDTAAVGVALSGNYHKPIEYTITVDPESNIQSNDYGTIKTSRLGRGGTDGTAKIPITSSGGDEELEYMRLRLSATVVGTGEPVPVTKSETTVYVLDRDDYARYYGRGLTWARATLSLQSDSNAEEGESVTLKVILSRTFSHAVTLPLLYSNSTAEASDYTAVPSIKVPANALQATVSIPLADDGVKEGKETFSVRLSDLPPGIVDGVSRSIRVTIADPGTSLKLSTQTEKKTQDTPKKKTQETQDTQNGDEENNSDADETKSSSPDREALMAIYDEAGGDGWDQNDNWGSDEPVGTWYGVETNSDNRVTDLRLQGNNLAGTMPAELGDMDALERLDLSYNAELGGELPRGLTETRLEYLDISGSGICLPEEEFRRWLMGITFTGNDDDACEEEQEVAEEVDNATGEGGCSVASRVSPWIPGRTLEILLTALALVSVGIMSSARHRKKDI